ncbi:MAG: gephyrin-like molybdotransferase Glp [Pseudomonadota bacterium]
MISVAEALDHLFALARPLGTEDVDLRHATGRVLAADAVALRTQPPFASSAMDGYAVRADAAVPGACFDVIGEAAAGHQFTGSVAPGQAVRIFTGAPLPAGTDRVVIQEDATRRDDRITLGESLDGQTYVRPAGSDFAAGTRLGAPRRLSASDVALLAAMNLPRITVTRKPVVAILATGDELVMPGEAPAPDQIVASNAFGLAGLLDAAGAAPRLLPIARDTRESLASAIALADGADLLVTIGGASVGDHDLVAEATETAGMERAFYKVAMRPGKPLMAGRLNDMAMIGLPGNPVSAMVCGEIFVRPVIDAMLGLPRAARATRSAQLAADLPANGPREHYMRASLGPEGVTAFSRQDSSLLTVLSDANCLLVRPPRDPALAAGTVVRIIAL